MALTRRYSATKPMFSLPRGDEPSADITLNEVDLRKGQKFALHYDFGDDWMFTITVSKIIEVQRDFEPRIVKSKGSIQRKWF